MKGGAVLTDDELILQVAQEVMKWDIFNNTRDDGPYLFKSDICIPHNQYRIKWNPLTNANHWMLVVERMRELGWVVFIDDDNAASWCCLFDHGYKPIIGRAYNKSIGHAVCEAAIAAIRIK